MIHGSLTLFQHTCEVFNHVILVKMASCITELEQVLLAIASATVQNVVVSQENSNTQQSLLVPDRTVVNNAPVIMLKVSVNFPAVNTNMKSSNSYTYYRGRLGY